MMGSTICTFLLLFLLMHNVHAFTVTRGSDQNGQEDDRERNGFEPRKQREFFLQAEKVEWDYLPKQQNLVGFYDEYVSASLCVSFFFSVAIYV